MSNKKSNISVVLPAYNEEARIAACLKSLTNQSVKPLEILLVNNNSTDQTLAIAKNFKSIKIIDEKRQGLIFARNTGFNAAKGKIIARIDADSIAPSDWIEQILAEFESDKQLAGLSGFGQNYSGIVSDTMSTIWSWFYFNHCLGFFGSKVLWGANMAISKKAWMDVRADCIADSFIHEDQDLSLALASKGYKLKINPKIKILCDFSDAQYLNKLHKYNKMKHRTRSLHRIHARSKNHADFKINLPKRVFLHIITDHSLAIYYIAVSLHSLYRYIKIQKSRLSIVPTSSE